MGITKIEWADKSWNPISGCSKISLGCQNCYAERMAKRLAGRAGYSKDKPFEVTFHPERLDDPLKWKKPRHVFVCSMGDLFHEDVPFGWIDEVMARIGFAKHHIFILLTKRPERMKKYFTVSREAHGCCGPWPWPHVWLMTTAENQNLADLRIPALLQIPGVLHGLSVEPGLGLIDLERSISLSKLPDVSTQARMIRRGGGIIKSNVAYLDWVVAGPETGPRRRPADIAWFNSLLSQCKAAGVPYFQKALEINGKISKNMDEWPSYLRIREIPAA